MLAESVSGGLNTAVTAGDESSFTPIPQPYLTERYELCIGVLMLTQTCLAWSA